MHRKRRKSIYKIFLVGFFLLFLFPLMVSAAQVALQWDGIDPAPEGYRLYQRRGGATFDYSAPKWSGTTTACTVEGLEVGVEYFFVVRAFQGSDESGDSNEVQYTSGSALEDSDGDGWNDAIDAFPLDPGEWIDTDGDGIGNQADTDDDGDGMPDLWEVQYGLNPLVNDASGDLDGDGVCNGDEFIMGSDPAQVADNAAPEKPILSLPGNGAQAVGLNPTLTTGAYMDSDFDAHARTRYQISTTSDFSALVFDKTFTQHLTQLRIADLILEPDTTYYWRVKFIDSHNGASPWSDGFEFATIDHAVAGDSDHNGILDFQELDWDTDLDRDGVHDAVQAGMQAVVTDDPFNPNVAVKCISNNAQVGSMMALDTAELPFAANQPENLTGVISFKLYLLDDAATTTVMVYFSQPAPANAQWYKFDPDEGWTVYPHAAFSEDRRAVTLILEDGGEGDQDGVRNGIIVDPSGLGYSSQTSEPSTYAPSDADGSSGGCFIAAPTGTMDLSETAGAIAFLLIGIILFGATAAQHRLNTDRSMK